MEQLRSQQLLHHLAVSLGVNQYIHRSSCKFPILSKGPLNGFQAGVKKKKMQNFAFHIVPSIFQNYSEERIPLRASLDFSTIVEKARGYPPRGGYVTVLLCYLKRETKVSRPLSAGQN